MFKHVNKYRPFIKVGMQGMVAYRANFFLQVIAQSLGAFSDLLSLACHFSILF